MADSHHYETGLVPENGSGFSGYDNWYVIKKIINFLDVTVQNGWECLDYTGNGRSNEDTVLEYIDSAGQLYNPKNLQISHELGDHDHGDTGLCPYIIGPSETSTAKSAYFRWSDGASNPDDGHFFLSTVAPEGEAQWADFRCGVLQKAYVPVQYFGGFFPSESPVAHKSFDGLSCVLPTIRPDPDYDTNTCSGNMTSIAGSLPNPTSFRYQPGYFGETRANNLYPGTGNSYRYHLFGGVDGGAGYFYCVVEGLDTDDSTTNNSKSFCHFSFGKVSPIGVYRGGEFANAMNWNSNSSYWNSVSDDRNSRPFDSHWNYNAQVGRSHIRFSPILDDEVDTQNYLFGNDYGGYLRPAFGDIFGGMNSAMRADAPTNAMTGRVNLTRNFIRVRDYVRGDGTYLLIGLAPAHRSLIMKNINPGEELTDLNGATWKIFPLACNRNLASRPYSGNAAVAYRIS